jgi:hypothetical protein
MIYIIDTVDISDIVQELSNCPASVWNDTKEYINPKDHINSTLSREAIVNGKNVTRYQDRIHVKWQADADGGNCNWWKDPGWRERPPVITLHGKTYFSKTISLLTDFYAARLQTVDRIFFSRLRPGLEIYPHRDGSWGNNFDRNMRYGLTIVTNDRCAITAGGHSLNPAPGTVFWFNNCEEHGAVNFGTTDRIVLYADVKPLI